MLSHLNDSRLFTGCVMLILNIGGKYIANDIPKNAERIFSHWISRLFIIFCIIFASTKDMIISLEITLIFIIVFKFLINEESKLCLIPKKYMIDMDENGDGVITKEEVERAQKIIDSYKAKL